MLPCCAQFHDSITNKRLQSPFIWRYPDKLPPLVEEEGEPSHIHLLEKYNIPYIVDIHSHFFPEIVMRLIWKWFDAVNWDIAYRFSEDKRVEYLYKNKIQKFTTLNYAHKPDMAAWLNQWVFQNYGRWKGAIPFGTFYPEPNVLDYTQKAVEEYGFKGFKLHCEVSKLNLSNPDLHSTFAYLSQRNIPIVIHTGVAPKRGEFTGIQYFLPFIKEFPELNVIVAHMGASEFVEYAELLEQFPNFKLDTTMVFVDFMATGSYHLLLQDKLEKFSDRIFFGSDFPNIPYILSHAILGILDLPISDKAKRNILYANAERLLTGFSS